MDLQAIKADLYELIDKQSDPNVLSALKALLEEMDFNPVLKEKLNSRAVKAEQDIKSGKTYSLDELKKHLNIQS